MQWNLRGLTHRSDEQQDADHTHQRPAGVTPDSDLGIGMAGSCRKHLSIIKAVEIHRYSGNAENKTKVAYTIDQKCLEIGKDRRITH